MMLEITFPTASPFTLAAMADATNPPDEIPGRAFLFLPQRFAVPKSRPAVIVLPGLGGLIEERELRYGRVLAREGYVVLVVDTFVTRNAAYETHPLRALRVTETMMVADAFAALRWLADHPMVDPERIGVMGFSYGGMVSVFCAYEQIRALYAPDGLRFAAHASYYGCSVARFVDPTTTGAPVRVFLGALDRNVCVDRTRQIVADLRRGGSDVDFHLYPEAYHQWDSMHRSLKFVRFSLRSCRFQVEPDNRIWDLKTGLSLRGPVSRTLAVAANADPRGYYMLRDEAILARSDATLLDFFGEALKKPRQAGALNPVPVRPGIDSAARSGSAMRQTAGSAAARQTS